MIDVLICILCKEGSPSDLPLRGALPLNTKYVGTQDISSCSGILYYHIVILLALAYPLDSDEEQDNIIPSEGVLEHAQIFSCDHHKSLDDCLSDSGIGRTKTGTITINSQLTKVTCPQVSIIL